MQTQALRAVERSQARTLLIDITGVPVVDTSVASYLLQTAQAAKLLGAQVILTGISPEIAQTIVQLGVPAGQLDTQSDLAAGIRSVLRRRGLGIMPLRPGLPGSPA
jgi:rsbT co-antagonist protein RsbR